MNLVSDSVSGTIPNIDVTAAPSGFGCADCLKAGKPNWWLHLRRCAECGHIGCCNDSPNQHATKHFHDTGHSVMQSFEPGESWFFDYIMNAIIFPNVVLAAPRAHPFGQPIPYFVK